MLDEILVLVAPVLLGDGTRLFDQPGGTNVTLERFSPTHMPQATNLWCRVGEVNRRAGTDAVAQPERPRR